MEACKELKEVREKYEAIMEKEARKSQLNGVGHNQRQQSMASMATAIILK